MIPRARTGNVFLNNKISSNGPVSIDFFIGGKLTKKVLRFTDVEKTGAHLSNPNFADSIESKSHPGFFSLASV